MKGVTIGNGAIVGSLSDVTRNIPPYAIVVGSPAQFIKWRHPEDIATRLEALAPTLPDFRSLSKRSWNATNPEALKSRVKSLP